MGRYLPAILIGVAAAFAMGLATTFVFPDSITPVFYGAGAGVFTAYILANLAGNRKVAVADAAAKAQALSFTPPAGKALLITYREGFVGRAAGLDLALDGQAFTQLRSPQFACLVLSPGAHALTGKFGGFAGAQSRAGTLSFEAVPGGVTVVKIGANMGMIQGAVAFEPQTDLAAARAKLERTPMVVSSPAEI